MEEISIMIPTLWKGLPVKLQRVSTTPDNEILNHHDVALIVNLTDINPMMYIKENDIVLLKSTDENYASHAFKYTTGISTKGKTHIFTPISGFLEREPLSYLTLDDVKILGKILCSFRSISEEIEYLSISD